jgi:hypothetical protein
MTRFAHTYRAKTKIGCDLCVHCYVRSRIHIFLVYKLLTIFLLVAFVQAVLPVDPKHPRIMRLIIDPIARTANDYAEFDTEESAEDWRREVTGMWYFCFILLVL